MATVLAATGAFVYVRVGDTLLERLDDSLSARGDALTEGVRSGAYDFLLVGSDEEFVQLVAPNGVVVDSSRGFEQTLLTSAELTATARRRAIEKDIVSSGAHESDEYRVHVRRVLGYFVVSGASLEDRDDALRSLLAQLLVVGPLALVLSSIGGYFLAAAALRPVEAMRREAEAVSGSEPGRRLTLTPANDEIRRLGDTLNGMLERLELALERERRFVADASHELRTPLAMLRTELELALRRERTPEEMEQALRSASEETERLSQLAEDLLVLARAQAGELPVRREEVSAGELLGGLRERFLQRASDEGREIAVDTKEHFTIFVDRLRLEQALGDLVDNALRHGGGRIVLEPRRHGASIELHVRDEGTGFSTGFIEHAFEPFSRGDAARTGGGAGLGLAIVDVIARAHGGSAHVANIDGGAEAWIALPPEEFYGDSQVP
jgi:signal transduction histidine kinase